MLVIMCYKPINIVLNHDTPSYLAYLSNIKPLRLYPYCMDYIELAYLL